MYLQYFRISVAVAVVHLASVAGMGAVGSSSVCDVARTKAKWLLVSGICAVFVWHAADFVENFCFG